MQQRGESNGGHVQLQAPTRTSSDGQCVVDATPAAIAAAAEWKGTYGCPGAIPLIPGCPAASRSTPPFQTPTAKQTLACVCRRCWQQHIISIPNHHCRFQPGWNARFEISTRTRVHALAGANSLFEMRFCFPHELSSDQSLASNTLINWVWGEGGSGRVWHWHSPAHGSFRSRVRVDPPRLQWSTDR
jgi:hypothetical protein